MNKKCFTKYYRTVICIEIRTSKDQQNWQYQSQTIEWDVNQHFVLILRQICPNRVLWIPTGNKSLLKKIVISLSTAISDNFIPRRDPLRTMATRTSCSLKFPPKKERLDPLVTSDEPAAPLSSTQPSPVWGNSSSSKVRALPRSLSAVNVSFWAKRVVLVQAIRGGTFPLTKLKNQKASHSICAPSWESVFFLLFCVWTPKVNGMPDENGAKTAEMPRYNRWNGRNCGANF